MRSRVAFLGLAALLALGGLFWFEQTRPHDRADDGRAPGRESPDDGVGTTAHTEPAARATAEDARTVDELVRALLSDDPAIRRVAANRLGRAYPSPIGVALLVDALQDDDATVREAAGASLGSLGRDGLTDYAHYLGHLDESDREGLAEVLRIVGRLSLALTPLDLVAALEEANAPSARRAAAACMILAPLTEATDDLTLDVLAELDRSEGPDVRSMAGASAALFGWSMVSDTHPATAADMKNVWRPSANDAWTTPLEIGLVGLLRPREPEWVSSLRKRDWGYLTHWGLERLGAPTPDTYTSRSAPNAVEDLITELEATERRLAGGEQEVPVGVWFTLNEIRKLGTDGAAATPVLGRLMAAHSGELRVRVAGTLLAVSDSHGGEVATALIEVLSDGSESPCTRRRALDLLLEMNAPARIAVPALLSVLDWPEGADAAELGPGFKSTLRAKRLVVDALGRLGPAAGAAKPKLAELTAHADSRLAYRARRALRLIG